MVKLLEDEKIGSTLYVQEQPFSTFVPSCLPFILYVHFIFQTLLQQHMSTQQQPILKHSHGRLN